MKTLLWLIDQFDPRLYERGVGNTEAHVVMIFVKPHDERTEELYRQWIYEQTLIGQLTTAEVSSVEEMERMALLMGREGRFDGVLTFNENLLEVTASIASQLGLLGNSVEAVRAAQNKFVQRQRFAEQGVPSARFALIAEEEDVASAVAAIRFPAVFKPVYGYGSYSVELVRDAEEFRRVYREQRMRYQNTVTSDRQVYFLLEEMLIGTSCYEAEGYADYISVESMIDGDEIVHLTVTDRLPLLPPFRERGLMLPSALPEEHCQAAFAVAEQAIRALGLTMGATHIEMKLTAEGPKVIEVNARPGEPLPYMLELCSGYDWSEQLARQALGLPLTERPKIERASAFIILHPEEDVSKARLVQVEGVEEAAQLPGVKQLVITKQVGDVLDAVNGYYDGLGYAYLEAGDLAQMWAGYRQMTDRLSFVAEALKEEAVVR